MPQLPMLINSDAINGRGTFDPRYTCDQDNSSPELRWTDFPPEAQGFAVVMEDPDAPGGTFCHWVIYNIPAIINHLPAGIPPQETLPNGIRQGLNSFGKLGYAGPCPPIRDSAHHYQFKLYALSALPEIQARCTREQLMDSITPFIIAEAVLTGLYRRAIQKAG